MDGYELGYMTATREHIETLDKLVEAAESEVELSIKIMSLILGVKAILSGASSDEAKNIVLLFEELALGA